MVYDARLAARVTSLVDRRLRMLAILKNQPLGHVLDGLLDQHLPPVDELAALLSRGDSGDGEPLEAVT